ncbi:MAG: type II toxin-antitoxin system VapC family toxin [Spirochaetaceae bacterium]|nr:type II toxin-antitoxin system VapC family toxin [Spirochaetaceae bacterium]MDE0230395.1 type II toxin-antitoxin system VapC family toxin [Spirochaetaceae bacterium]
MTLVLDASAAVAVLVDKGADGRWARRQLATGSAAAPHLMLAEAANILRRATLSGEISVDTASLAHADLLDLDVELFDYRPLAARAWQLHENVTIYDGWYVALAESLAVDLITLDRRLARASGCLCAFRTPDE